MSTAQTSAIHFDRSYDATVEDLWELWTTKSGFESWWGPEGFRVEVRALDLRVGGELHYAMIACGAEEIAYMQKSGMGTSHETRGRFVEIEPLRRLQIRHIIDFIPGLEPYENNMLVEFFEEGDRARMKITIDAHRTEEWTQNAKAGMESQLKKVPAALSLSTGRLRD